MLLSERPEPSGTARQRIRRTIPQPSLLTRPFEGADILEELPPEAAHELFQRARDVALWSGTPADVRDELLAGGRFSLLAPVDQALREPVSTLRRIVTRPASATPQSIADACTAISDWAADEGFTRTCIYFAELAAASVPNDSLATIKAGRINRFHAQYERAKHWFECAVDVSRVQENRSAQASALLSWGNLEFQRGNHFAARRLFGRAWRVAKKYHLREEGGAARHNQMTLALELGKFDEAQEHAVAALRFYGKGYERLPYFAHDVAQLWNWQRFYVLAIPIFTIVKDLIVPEERLKCMANLGRAAAGVGDASTFFDAWREVTTYDGRRAAPDLAEAYINIGEGALLLGLYARAHEVASRALIIARQRGDEANEEQANSILRRVAVQEERPAPAHPPDSARALARWLTKALQPSGELT
jgi:tetratricopeptide (TPR) repeat protein